MKAFFPGFGITDLSFNYPPACRRLLNGRKQAIMLLLVGVATMGCEADSCEGASCDGPERGEETTEEKTQQPRPETSLDAGPTDAGDSDETEQLFVECDAGASGLPISDVAEVTPSCETAGIGGWWYCFEDDVNPSTCTEGELPYDAERGGLCLSGSTTYDPEYVAFGAGVGLTLNQGDGGRRPWDASARNIIGFRFVISGETNGLTVRAIFTSSANDAAEDPMLDLPGPGEYEVLFDYVVYPGESPRAGEPIDPRALYDAQLMIVGAESETTYDFCLTELSPIYGD